MPLGDIDLVSAWSFNGETLVDAVVDKETVAGVISLCDDLDHFLRHGRADYA